MSEGGLTVAAKFEVENIADTDVNNAEKTIVSPFKLALVEDLDCDHGRIVRDGTIQCKKNKCTELSTRETATNMSKLSFQYGFKVFFVTLVV
jgi:hypothetical protein